MMYLHIYVYWNAYALGRKFKVAYMTRLGAITYCLYNLSRDHFFFSINFVKCAWGAYGFQIYTFLFRLLAHD